MIDKQERSFDDEQNYPMFELEEIEIELGKQITDDMFSGEIVEDE